MKFQFGNVVVVGDHIGVIVKSWADNTYDVYLRYYNNVSHSIDEENIHHYVYSKELSDEERGFYSR